MASDELELDSPPSFDIGEKVRVRKLIRNDGTFPGQEIGATLAKKGDVGYVVSIGTFLQNSYIYAVHFLETGYVVGCRKKELETAEVSEMKVMLRRSDAGKLLAYVAKKDLEEEVVEQTDGAEGKIFTLANGWELAVSGLPEPLQLPQTVEAKRLS
jgi:nitrogen fixation protein NifZ